jgi:hypothetical protein
MRYLVGGVAVLGAAAAALLGAGAASADDMQISIDGYDLFPTAGNTATALSSTGDMAIAIGNGASANALNNPSDTNPEFGNFAFADGTGDSANAGGGIFDTAMTFGGTDSTTYAGFTGNFDLALATAGDDTLEVGGGGTSSGSFDLGWLGHDGYVGGVGPGDLQFAAVLPDGTVIDPAAADPMAGLDSLITSLFGSL